jgi:hypothetical protein
MGVRSRRTILYTVEMYIVRVNALMCGLIHPGTLYPAIITGDLSGVGEAGESQ